MRTKSLTDNKFHFRSRIETILVVFLNINYDDYLILLRLHISQNMLSFGKTLGTNEKTDRIVFRWRIADNKLWKIHETSLVFFSNLLLNLLLYILFAFWNEVLLRCFCFQRVQFMFLGIVKVYFSYPVLRMYDCTKLVFVLNGVIELCSTSTFWPILKPFLNSSDSIIWKTQFFSFCF